MSERPWIATLNAFALRVAAQRAAFEAGGVAAVPAFEAADLLGPLPGHLRERASAMLADARALEADLQAAADAALTDLTAARRATSAAAAYDRSATPMFLDARA